MLLAASRLVPVVILLGFSSWCCIFPAFGTLDKLPELCASVSSSMKWAMIIVPTSQGCGGAHWFPRATVTNCCKLGSLRQGMVSPFSRPEIQNQGVGRALLLWKPLEEKPSLPTLGGCRGPLACGCITPGSAPSPCGLLRVSPPCVF